MKIRIAERIRQIMPECKLGITVIREITVKGTPAPLIKEFAQLQE